jgi:two-component system sensor histidine kinase QseC
VKSIRSFLLRRLLGGTALVLVAAGIAVSLLVARSLEAQFDRNLDDRVQAFASILFQEGDRLELEFSEELMPEYARAQAPDYFEVGLDRGPTFERSDSLGEGSLAVPVELGGELGAEPTWWSAPLPDGRDGRYVGRVVEIHHVYPEEGPDRPIPARIRVVVARGREELVAAERGVLAWSALVCLVLIGGIAFLSWTAVHRGLEPAQRLARAVDALDVQHLPASLGLGEMPSELRPVAEKTDALLRRVDGALRRERRTTADIAHELRTPISEVVTASEVALRDGGDVEGLRRSLATVRAVAWRMGRSVATLLELARLEMGVDRPARESVDLAQILRESLRSAAATGPDRAVRVLNLVAEAETVLGDPEILRIIVSNLVSNALAYARPGTPVECRLERERGGWSLAVANDAADLSEEDLASLAEPFWRKDRSRSDRDRSGLGLALSRALAVKCGMELRFELEGGRFAATLHGPRDRAGGAGRETGLADVSSKSLR